MTIQPFKVIKSHSIPGQLGNTRRNAKVKDDTSAAIGIHRGLRYNAATLSEAIFR